MEGWEKCTEERPLNKDNVKRLWRKAGKKDMEEISEMKAGNAWNNGLERKNEGTFYHIVQFNISL